MPARRRLPIDQLVEEALNMATADGKRGRNSTGVRAWVAFVEDVLGESPHRVLDPNVPLWVKLEEEYLAMRFVCALVEERGVTPKTAYQYFCQVQGWHVREHGIKLAGGMKLERLPQMLKGLRRKYGDRAEAIRRGISPDQLRLAMDKNLDPKNPLHANIRAALAVALQGLLRSAEYTVKDGVKFNNKLHLCRIDIVSLEDGRVVFMIHPCKNMRHIGGKTCPLVIGAGGEYVDAVAEMRNLLLVDPTPRGAKSTTPLFRDPRTNQPLTYDFMLEQIRILMASIGERAGEFGTHSLRIGGATALFSQGATELVIRTMGRWSSDIHRLYVRACFEQCCSWTKAAGSAKVSDIAGATFAEADEDYY